MFIKLSGKTFLDIDCDSSYKIYNIILSTSETDSVNKSLVFENELIIFQQYMYYYIFQLRNRKFEMNGRKTKISIYILLQRIFKENLI